MDTATVLEYHPELSALPDIDQWEWWPIRERHTVALAGQRSTATHVVLLYLYGDHAGTAHVDTMWPGARAFWSEVGTVREAIAWTTTPPSLCSQSAEQHLVTRTRKDT
ncbi:hypothetical protein [Gandjariella thermophila]|uniref:Uncharacterized protein n=1 Tax=Gandjariella thermophila TaxID=1931992 RepID=A0A4D4IZT4_9PSEU|nr:hypothetical protein [Gandjariella thermophila]GDY29855.1 hypothetical protein GTS_14880 [Gandjariella thermophila]